jgi:hypothetical protein
MGIDLASEPGFRGETLATNRVNQAKAIYLKNKGIKITKGRNKALNFYGFLKDVAVNSDESKSLKLIRISKQCGHFMMHFFVRFFFLYSLKKNVKKLTPSSGGLLYFGLY